MSFIENLKIAIKEERKIISNLRISLVDNQIEIDKLMTKVNCLESEIESIRDKIILSLNILKVYEKELRKNES